MKKRPLLDALSALVFTVLILVDGSVWYAITQHPEKEYRIDFLDVGQGDSQLVTLGDVQIMTDAGPGGDTLRSLSALLPASDRYIDLLIITHPEKDHFGGFTTVLDHYAVGAVLWNGFAQPSGTAPEWEALQEVIAKKNIPFFIIGAGDTITYGSSTVAILAPDPLLLGGAAANDAGIVQKIVTPDWSALLTADIGFSVEAYLMKHHDLSADILKIGHHGSRFSSNMEFLNAVHPSIAAIQVGGRNTYGHPTLEALARLASSTARVVVRNDLQGTISIIRTAQGLSITTER